MAVASQGWELVSQWIDTGGNTTQKTDRLTAVDTAGDATAVFADVSTILAARVAVTDAHLSSYRVAKIEVEDALTLPTGDVNVEEQLQISAKIDGVPNKSAVIEIPAPKSTLFAETTGPGHNQADFAVTALANFVNLFKAGAQILVSDGEAITDQNIKGRRTHHKSTKG
jgi:hypothetical protein